MLCRFVSETSFHLLISFKTRSSHSFSTFHRVIRHLDVNPMNENLTDKLRIQIYQSNNAKTIIGKKDLPLTLLPRKLNNENDMNFGSFATMSSGAGGGNSLNSMFNINNTNFIPNTQLNQSKSKL